MRLRSACPRLSVLGTIAALLAAPGPALAQGFLPVGSEIFIEQEGVKDPKMSFSSADAPLVVWKQVRSGDIEARGLDGDGLPVGSAFVVNEDEPIDRVSLADPDIASGSTGSNVVIWRFSDREPDGVREVRGRRVASTGAPIGAEFTVHSATTGDQREASIAARPDGSFVVAFRSEGVPTLRKLGGDGLPLGSDLVLGPDNGVARTSDVATLPGGGAFVLWGAFNENGGDDSSQSVRAQLADGDGLPLGLEFQVNDYSTGNQSLPTIAVAPDGTTLVTWTSDGTPREALDADVDEASIQGQRFDATGAPLGGQFEINGETTNRQVASTVVADGAGGFAVVWVTNGGLATPPPELRMQRVSLSGELLGAEIRVDESGTRSDPADPVSDGEGEVWVVWPTRDVDGLSVRHFVVDDTPAR